jgi:hypothetical protein
MSQNGLVAHREGDGVLFRPVALAAVCLAVALAGCGSDNGAPASAPASPSPTVEETSPIDGTWKTGPISQEDVEGTLRKYGLAKWIKRFRAVGIFKSELTLILDLKEGEWDLHGKPRGGPREEIDYDADYVVEGNRVDKIHATGATTFRWSVTGEVLSLEWIKTTEPAFRGIPDEVFQRALYMTEDFSRQG